MLAVLVGFFAMPACATVATACFGQMEAMSLTTVTSVEAAASTFTSSVSSVLESGRSHEVGTVRPASTSASSEADRTGDQAVVALSGGGMRMTLLGTCLTVLMVGVGAAFLWLRGRRRRRPGWIHPRSVVAGAGPGRQPDPPSLLHLSIRRC
ncbi:hypothetical protein [Nocardioides caricicola]|uniref:LPXTG cell wall anchor domain-containing protein n=1 Tax=Nocardioides caricicola TaxID=634770 RepID=A0ABW0N6V4_9ACTN